MLEALLYYFQHRHKHTHTHKNSNESLLWHSKQMCKGLKRIHQLITSHHIQMIRDVKTHNSYNLFRCKPFGFSTQIKTQIQLEIWKTYRNHQHWACAVALKISIWIFSWNTFFLLFRLWMLPFDKLQCSLCNT